MKIGIDLGGSHIAIGVVDNNGRIIEKVEQRITSKDKKNIKKFLENVIVDSVNNMSKKHKITHIGIAVPGTVRNGTIVKSVNLGLKEYPIVEILQEKIELPIIIRNDAKCAAIAENKYGCLKKYKRTIFLTLGTGIGGAVIINNQLLDTGENPGCEFGHMVIDKDGVPCKCGKNGCFEKYASMKVFKDNLREALGFDEKTHSEKLLDIIRNNKSSHKEYEAIEQTIRIYVENLALGIGNLINIFEPEAIGIGGSFVYFEDVLLKKLEKELLKKNALFNSKDSINIETAVLGNDAGIIGASL